MTRTGASLAFALACITAAGCSSNNDPDVLTVTPVAANLEPCTTRAAT